MNIHEHRPKVSSNQTLTNESIVNTKTYSIRFKISAALKFMDIHEYLRILQYSRVIRKACNHADTGRTRVTYLPNRAGTGIILCVSMDTH